MKLINRMKSPNTYFLMFCMILVAALATWVIPSGTFETQDHNGRQIVVAGSYKAVPSEPQRLLDVLMAPIHGFERAASVIAFVLLVGGAFGVLQRTGAVDAAIRRVARVGARSEKAQLAVIPLVMFIFSAGGAVFGMSEEVIPFILIFVPLALSLGYDSIVGVAMPFIGAGAGFASAFVNPFTLGVAQGIAQLPPLSGLAYRVFCWVVITAVACVFVMVYAARIKKDPSRSPVFEIDEEKRKQRDVTPTENTVFTANQKWVLVSFAVCMGVLVFGVLRYQWYIQPISAIFLAAGIAAGILSRMKLKAFTDAFVEGAQGLLGTALIIALANGILVIAEDGRVIHTILNWVAGLAEGFHPVVSSHIMFGVQSCLNFLVPSGSGQAALTMPIMSPLADLLGVSRQTAVLAFQFGDGFTNLIIPTSGVCMGVLALGKIPWEKWARWMLPLQVIFILLGMALLIPPFFMQW